MRKWVGSCWARTNSRGEKRFGLSGAGAGAAHQDDLGVEVGAQLGAMLAEQVERHVVGAGEVRRLELGGGTHVEHGGRCQRRAVRAGGRLLG